MSDAAWRLWVSSWLLVDDAGNCRAGDKYLASLVWQDSGKAPQIPSLLAELQVARRASVYTNGSERYMALRNWAKHQRIDNAGKARVPGPDHIDSMTWDESRGFRRELLGATVQPKSSPLDQRPPTSDQRPRPADPSGSASVGPLTLALVDPPTKALDFESTYRKFPRKEGKKRGLEIFERDITPKNFADWQRSVANYAAHVVGREPQRIKQFDTFMGCWSEYVDFTPSPSQPGRSVPPEPPPREYEDLGDKARRIASE